MKKKTNWEKIFRLGDKIYFLMALDKRSNPNTKDSTKWYRKKYKFT